MRTNWAVAEALIVSRRFHCIGTVNKSRMLVQLSGISKSAKLNRERDEKGASHTDEPSVLSIAGTTKPMMESSCLHHAGFRVTAWRMPLMVVKQAGCGGRVDR